MLPTQRRAELIFAALFGAWLGGVYSLVTQAINWLFLPDIPLSPPGNSLLGYLFQYILMGALLGLISALPENRWAGAALGGLSAALLMAFQSLRLTWGSDSFSSSLITVLLTFLPLVIFMMPVALFIRLGVDAQHVDQSRPYLWARRYLIPALLTTAVVLVGSLSLYSPDVRNAFRFTNRMVQQGLAASTESALPDPLREVSGFTDQASGTYTLSWSDRVDTFFGPRPSGAELSQFLIITRFQDGFTFACIFSENRSVPNCTKY